MPPITLSPSLQIYLKTSRFTIRASAVDKKTNMIHAILEHHDVERLIHLALDEDGATNDLTTLATGPEGMAKRTRATILAKKPAIAAGYPIVEKILRIAGA